jgi:hypothetical protein
VCHTLVIDLDHEVQCSGGAVEQRTARRPRAVVGVHRSDHADLRANVIHVPPHRVRRRRIGIERHALASGLAGFGDRHPDPAAKGQRTMAKLRAEASRHRDRAWSVTGAVPCLRADEQVRFWNGAEKLLRQGSPVIGQHQVAADDGDVIEESGAMRRVGDRRDADREGQRVLRRPFDRGDLIECQWIDQRRVAVAVPDRGDPHHVSMHRIGIAGCARQWA